MILFSFNNISSPQEKLTQLQTEIDELRLNLPKKTLEKMEKMKKLAEQQELGEDGDGQGRGQTKSGGSCSIS